MTLRPLTCLVACALALEGLAPVAAVAQSRTDRYAVDACRPAIRGEVEARFPQAYGVRLSDETTQPVGRDQVQVTGRGEFDDRNGGAARFTYACSFNDRTGATFALDVRDVRPLSDGKGKKDNSAAIAGLVLGAIIVGAAVAASNDKDKDRDRYEGDRYRQGRRGDFSPEAGVVCNRREAACYKDGRYSDKWTRRVFVR